MEHYNLKRMIMKKSIILLAMVFWFRIAGNGIY